MNPMVLLSIRSHAIGSRKSKMAVVKTQAAITFERIEITMRFQFLPHIFDQARHGYDTVDISRRRAPTEFKMAATETGSGNNF